MKCCICDLDITNRYYYDEYGNASHTQHNGSAIPFCFYCGRIISKKSSWSGKNKKYGYQVKDKILMCGICSEDIVLHNHEVDRSVGKVLSIVSDFGFRIDMTGINVLAISYKEFKSRKMVGCDGTCETFLEEKKFKAANIYVINGVPRIYFESVLAHELFHALLYQKNIKMKSFEEAFCNIGNAVILDYYITNYKSKVAKRLFDYLELNPDIYYGRNYRVLKDELRRKGWKKFLSDVKRKYKENEL